MATDKEEVRRVVRGKVDRKGELVSDSAAIDPELLQANRSRKTLLVITLILCALLVGLLVSLYALTRPVAKTSSTPGEAKTGPMEWQQSIYQTGTDKKERLLAPTSAAVDRNGTIYVTEPQRARISVFNADGSFSRYLQTPLDKSGTRAMLRPESVFVDTDGRLYVADPTRGAVFVFDTKNDDALKATIPLGEEAHGITADGKNLYILGQGRVYTYDKKTYRQKSWFGSLGSYPGEINAYQGIAVKNGTIYIADSFNRRLEAFSTAGKLLWNSETKVKATDNPWQLPQDLTIDASGRLVVVDAMAFSLSSVDASSGAVTDTWGEFGSADGDFAYPSSVAYDSVRDRYVVADTKNDRIEIVKLPGSTSTPFAVVRTIQVSPWRYLIVPAIVCILLFVIWLLGRAVYSALRKRRPLERTKEAEQATASPKASVASGTQNTQKADAPSPKKTAAPARPKDDVKERPKSNASKNDTKKPAKKRSPKPSKSRPATSTKGSSAKPANGSSGKSAKGDAAKRAKRGKDNGNDKKK